MGTVVSAEIRCQCSQVRAVDITIEIEIPFTGISSIDDLKFFKDPVMESQFIDGS